MARVISTISLKGGVGKTTVTAGLAEFMSVCFGKRVLCIDLDAQTNLTTMLIGAEHWLRCNQDGHTLAALFADALDDTGEFDMAATLQREVSPVAEVTGVDLLPSSLDLIELGEELSAARVAADDHAAAVTILGRAVATVADDYDFILIDCPPNVGPFSLNALAISDGYLIPAIPDVLSSYAIPHIQRHISEFAVEIGRPIVELGVVLSKYRASSTLHKTTARRLRRDPTIHNVLPAYLSEGNVVAAAAEFRPYSTLHAKYGYDGHFDQFRELTRAVLVEADVKLA